MSPFFAGHFPGAPVLPGVAHLELVAELLRAHGARALAILGIEALRFRAPIGPGDELEVRLDAPDPRGRVGFEIRRGGRTVSGGVLFVG